MTALDKKDPGADMASQNQDPSPISLLKKIRGQGRVWEDLAEQYGVDNPDPPWRANLDAMFEALDIGKSLPELDRRWEDDESVEAIYADVPFPERQLLMLAHSMIQRGLLDEDEIARRMKEVDQRFNSA